MKIVKIFLKFGLLFLLSAAFSIAANLLLNNLGLIDSQALTFISITFCSLLMLNVLTALFSDRLSNLAFLKINTDFFTVLITSIIVGLLLKIQGFIATSLIITTAYCLFLERLKINFLYNKILFLILFISSITLLDSGLSFYFKSFFTLNLFSLIVYIAAVSKFENFMSTDDQ